MVLRFDLESSNESMKNRSARTLRTTTGGGPIYRSWGFKDLIASSRGRDTSCDTARRARHRVGRAAADAAQACSIRVGVALARGTRRPTSFSPSPAARVESGQHELNKTSCPCGTVPDQQGVLPRLVLQFGQLSTLSTSPWDRRDVRDAGCTASRLNGRSCRPCGCHGPVLASAGAIARRLPCSPRHTTFCDSTFMCTRVPSQRRTRFRGVPAAFYLLIPRRRSCVPGFVPTPERRAVWSVSGRRGGSLGLGAPSLRGPSGDLPIEGNDIASPFAAVARRTRFAMTTGATTSERPLSGGAGTLRAVEREGSGRARVSSTSGTAKRGRMDQRRRQRPCEDAARSRKCQKAALSLRRAEDSGGGTGFNRSDGREKCPNGAISG